MNCPSCRAAIAPQAIRCGACGRSLVSAAGTPAHAPATKPSAVGFRLTDHVVSLAVGLVWGIIGFASAFFLLRRVVVRHGDQPGVWACLFVVGFCAPAAYGFYRSYKQDIEIRERERNGLAPSAAAGAPRAEGRDEALAAAPPPPVQRHQDRTPFALRTRLGYLPADCVLNLKKLQEWDPQVCASEAPDDMQTVGGLRRAVAKGDSQPAVVVEATDRRIIVAAYSDECDTYVFLGFDGHQRELLSRSGIATVGCQLVCNWIYWTPDVLRHDDIVCGPHASGQYAAGWPVLADLVVSDHVRLHTMKAAFGPEMYRILLEASRDVLKRTDPRIRDGVPTRSYKAYLPASA